MLCLSLASLTAAALLVPDVVELKDGTRHAGEVRSRKNGVELITPIGLQRFDASDIAAIEPRNEQLPLYKSALSTAGRQPHALVSLARWCVDHGLYPEAFDAVDRAAEAAPQDPAVTDAIASLATECVLDGVAPNEFPDADRRERLLERVGGKSPSRAAFAKEVLLHASREELIPWLVQELNDLDHPVRLGAIDLLGELRSDQGLAKLIRSSLVDQSAQIRDHARVAALRSNHPDLASPYLRALQIDDEELRERAYPALAEIRDPRVVPALIGMLEPHPVVKAGGGPGTLPRAHVFFGTQRTFIQDFDVEIAQGAVIAKPVIGVLQDGVLLDVAIAGVVEISHVERASVVSALRKLSGQQFDGNPVAWQKWWSGQNGQLPDPPPAAATADTTGHS